MFRVVLTLIITLMHVYVFWRAGSMPFITRRFKTKYIIGAGIVLWTLFLLGVLFGHDNNGFMSIMFELIGMNWMGSLFMITMSLFAIDLLTGFGVIFRKIAVSLRGFALILGAVISAFALMQGMREPIIQDYDIYLSNLPKEIDDKVIIAVSDLHLGSILGKSWLEKRITQIEDEQPDLIVMLGDIFEGRWEQRKKDEFIPLLRRISAPLGVYAVLGNHEFYGDLNTNINLIKDAGFILLRDKWIEIKRGFILAGVDDLTHGGRLGQNNGDHVSKALDGIPKRSAILLLSHTPWEAEKAAEKNVGLMLSGHTHGGQIYPFDYLVKRKYSLFAGAYNIEGMTVIVSRGAGTWGPRMRFWNRSEILKITLHVKD